MAKQTINQGTAPTGAGGDTFRTGSAKLQANDDEIYSQLGANTQGVLPAALPVNKGGTGAATVAAARTNLGLTLTTSTADSTVGRVLKVGDFGLGAPVGPESQIILDTSKASGIYHVPLASVQGNVGIPAGTWAALVLENSVILAPFNLRHDIYVGNMLLNSGSSAVKRYFKLYGEMNTTKDANGFIKAASPIVRIFANKIELNYDAVQQSITFEKLGIGNYLIKDSSGFAQEGWYIETPKDANGNVLFSVIYTTLENGDISVKTYKKKFDFETVSIVADLDNPVDITENRWIDLRLQELPQPEIEEPESIAPPDFQPTGLAQAVATVMESYHDPEQ